MSHLTIVATLIAKDAHRDELLKLLANLVEGSRKEEGNISYELNVDSKNKNRFIFIEKWKSQEIIEKHNKSVNFQTFVKESEGKTESLTVDIMTQVF